MVFFYLFCVVGLAGGAWMLVEVVRLLLLLRKPFGKRGDVLYKMELLSLKFLIWLIAVGMLGECSNIMLFHAR